jgi:hypothetical protein
MENNRDYNINQIKKKSRKNSIHRKPYYLQKIESKNTMSHEGRTKESVEPVYRIYHGKNFFTWSLWKKSEKYTEKKLYQFKRLIRNNGQSTASPIERTGQPILKNQLQCILLQEKEGRNRTKKNKHRLKQQKISTDHSPKKNSTRHFQKTKDHHQDKTTSTMTP